MLVDGQENTGAADEVVDTSAENTDSSAENTEQADASGAGNEADAQAAALLESENADAPEDGGEKPAFKPNIKFKVLDKEMEIPEKFRALMTDAESEKTVRELFEKAEGLPTVKQKLETVRGENQTLSKKVSQYDQTVSYLQNTMKQAVTSGNWHKLDDWFKVFDVPESVVVNYALAKVKLAEMDPAQRQMIIGQLDAERNVEVQRQQNADLRTNFESEARKTRNLELQFQLTNPEYKSAAEAYEKQVGKPGSFEAAVRQAGLLAWHTEKVDLTAQQAIDRVIENYGLKNRAQAGGTPPPASNASGTTATIVVKKPVSTIPNIGGGSKSPVGTGKVKTLDDLKKVRDEAWGKSS